MGPLPHRAPKVGEKEFSFKNFNQLVFDLCKFGILSKVGKI